MHYYDVRERIIAEGEYLADSLSTVRETAIKFSVSKSTVHKDLSLKLKDIDEELFARVQAVLSINLAERHVRGGEATRKKHKEKKLSLVLFDKKQI